MALWRVHESQFSEECARCFCASTVCQNKVYLHGGYDTTSSQNEPLRDIIVFNPTDLSVTKIQAKNVGPTRSHHAAVTLDDRFCCFVGGWDGKKRTTEVWTFDVNANEWTLLNPDPTSSPPAGLSSHTCTSVGTREMIVTGREGGVRTQRRYGSVFKLIVDLNKSTYIYQELPHHISSRSGHTACLLHSHRSRPKDTHLVITGGRDSTSSDLIPVQSAASRLCNNDLKKTIDELMTSKAPSLSSVKPTALKHHTAVSAGTWCVIHGGEMFGKVRDCTSPALVVHDASGSKWWKVKVEEAASANSLKRNGHSMVWLQGRLYLIGGVGDSSRKALSTVIELRPPG